MIDLGHRKSLVRRANQRVIKRVSTFGFVKRLITRWKTKVFGPANHLTRSVTEPARNTEHAHQHPQLRHSTSAPAVYCSFNINGRTHAVLSPQATEKLDPLAMSTATNATALGDVMS